MGLNNSPCFVYLQGLERERAVRPHLSIDLKIDNLDRVSIPAKIVATFDVEHPIHGTTYGV